jgi:hypothetical protein
MSRAFTANRRQLTALRLAAQRVDRPMASIADTVRHLLGVQAQDFAGAKWTLGLRTTGTTDASIEAALASRAIVRSWPMRGTLHFTAPEDLGWMLSVTAERTMRTAAGRHTQLELTDRDFARAAEIATEQLSGGHSIQRGALLAAFDAGGISIAGQRGAHLLGFLAHSQLIVFAAVEGKQQTFALLDEWVPKPRVLDRDEALGEFARRYFTSHGPATIRDFAWWASLTLTDARRGLAIARDDLDELIVDDLSYFLAKDAVPAPAAVHALPGFDEYLLGYSDRSAQLAPEHFESVVPGSNGMFLSTIVADGEVIGTWRRTIAAKTVTIETQPFGRLTKEQREGFETAATRYGEFLEREPLFL